MDDNRAEAAGTFAQAISLQAAARTARPPLTYFELQQAIRAVDLQEHVSRLRSFKLVLAFAIGAAVYAAIIYYSVGISLR